MMNTLQPISIEGVVCLLKVALRKMTFMIVYM